jgi:hypothetical protein
MDDQGARDQRLVLATVLATLVLVIAGLFVALFTSDTADVPVVTAIVACVVLMLLVPQMSRVVAVKGFGVEATMAARIEKVEGAVDETNRRIDALFALSISDWQYRNLVKLASGTFGPFVRSLGLENDLRHLRNHGYVAIPSVRDIPDRGDELCTHVEVTDTGRKFVELREELQLAAAEVVVQEALLRPAARDGRAPAGAAADPSSPPDGC